MSKQATIRNFANSTFLQVLKTQALPFTAATGRAFRLQVRTAVIRAMALADGIAEADIPAVTVKYDAAASTHYAYAFNRIKASEPELVTGLGRPPEKNNGGRKRKQADAAPASPVDELTPDLGEAQQVFEVRRCKDDAVVATGLSFEDARAQVQKNAAQKKAKLYWV